MQVTETIAVNITLNLNPTAYREFRRIFDATTEQEFFTWAINSHIDEIVNDNPELLFEWMKEQRKRQAMEAQPCQ